MKQNKQPSTRKPPTLSAEEELAELLSDPTLKPSISFLGLRDTSPAQRTVSVPDTESVSGTDTVIPRSSKAPRIIFNRQNTVSVSGTAPVSDTDTVQRGESVPDTETVSDTDTVRLVDKRPGPSSHYQAPRPRHAESAEDGHSHGEQHLYEALWAAGEPRDRDTRSISLGFGAMSRLARLSLNNCRLNIRSLVRKLAIEEIGEAHCEQRVGKTYLVHSPAAILRRRKAAGFEWVIRTKGVVFVDPDTGTVLTHPVTPNGTFKQP